MQFDRLGNSRRNALWGMVDKLIAIILPFAVRTVLIREMGMAYAGVGGLFTSVLDILNLTEMGVASAIIYSLYKPLARGDRDTVCALMRFYRTAYRIIGTVILAAGLALLPVVEHLVSGETPQGISLQGAYVIYLLNSALSYFGFAHSRSLMIAVQRNDVNNRINACIKLLSSTVQITVLIVWKNFYIYALVLPLATLANNLWCGWQAKRLYPEYLCRGRLQDVQRRDIVEKTKGLLLHRLCGSMRNSCDSVFISAYLGLAAVGMYNNYFYIMSSVRGLLDVVTRAVSAGIGNSVAVESVENNYRKLQVLTFVYEWICGWCTTCLLCLYQPFMTLWVGPEGLLPMETVAAICLYFYVWTLGDIKSQFADARGVWWKDRYRAGLEALLNLALNWTLIHFWGLTGVVLATVLSILLLGFPWSTQIIFRDYFKSYRVRDYFAVQLRYALTTMLACAATWLSCEALPLTGAVGLIVRMAVCCIIPNAVYLVCYGRSDMLREAMPYIRRLMKR